jgi:hypothetical protein
MTITTIIVLVLAIPLVLWAIQMDRLADYRAGDDADTQPREVAFTLSKTKNVNDG